MRATYTVEDVTLAFDEESGGNETHRLSVAFCVGLLVVDFNRPVHVRRNLNADGAAWGSSSFSLFSKVAYILRSWANRTFAPR